ncbi:hypothetical protein K2805_005158 [Salmonella enterica]|nr:hypothetical protein [Salmonella enterica]EIL4070537.1 hypothetical protein [Salmonella enterica]
MEVTEEMEGPVTTGGMVAKAETLVVTPVEVMVDMVGIAEKVGTMEGTVVKVEMAAQVITHQVEMAVMEVKAAAVEMLPEETEEMEVREGTVITRPGGMVLPVEMGGTTRETTTGIIQGMLTVPGTETGAVMVNTNHQIKTEIHYA